ncbi:DegT/DnrJ/EryC1/StrS family aminotransferase [Streptomyces sp. CA-210063]|uniref:DegT/DnrJ/EryC1/StrS family aminotransferase n=1 Tax=Streptomyces sp. CA-210063 TaxID=2801029 RepID=UPI00214B8BDE|nr:DegT/DnrJ/EryC1/StrS family aminotransferase [Streptomyces sp. CA-210063]UUU30446.1 DegT/DnrJ/EryC1/StrS family aminotransferase [Streptomyces sp. CA-210063]
MPETPLALFGGDPVVAEPPRWPQRGPQEARMLREVLDDGQWSLHGGTHGTRFESRFAALQGLGHVLTVSNGTVALQLACEALGLGPGDEVIVPGLTRPGAAGAVLDANAVPVLVDVDPDTWCLDPAAVEAAITERTRAVVAVHLYGTMPDLTALAALSARYCLALIEDCAHAHGARWERHGAGSVGTLSCFSFQMSRTLTAGEGGCVATADPLLAGRLAGLRDCGRAPVGSPPGWRPLQGGNHRMTEWQAAILLAQCDRFAEQRERRETVTRRWREAALAHGFLRPALLLPQVERPPGYALALSYVPDAALLRDIPVTTVRAALTAELGVPVEACYRPLDDSPSYLPHSKPRHRLNQEYWEAVDPRRARLPHCARLYDSSVILPHTAMLCPGAEEHLPRALDRLARNAGHLRDWAAGRRRAAA